MKDKSLFTNNQSQTISEGLQNFINAMVEEIVLDGKPFDTQKKYLKKFSENEGMNYEAIENGITELVETLQEMKSTDSKLLKKLALIQAKEACVTEEEVLKIVELMDKKEDGCQSVEYEYVDLGLPSGTLWATFNVGATKPEEFGDYFAWGETEPKSIYDWSTYKYANGNYDKFTKYCNDSDFGNNGFTDDLTTLQIGDDPAASNWSSDWCMPTKEQWEELFENTTNEWTMQNGVKGRLFISKKNGKSLFLPAAGWRRDDELYSVGSYGYYWSGSLFTAYPSRAWGFLFGSDRYSVYYDLRHYGLSVRAVRFVRQN